MSNEKLFFGAECFQVCPDRKIRRQVFGNLTQYIGKDSRDGVYGYRWTVSRREITINDLRYADNSVIDRLLRTRRIYGHYVHLWANGHEYLHSVHEFFHDATREMEKCMCLDILANCPKLFLTMTEARQCTAQL